MTSRRRAPIALLLAGALTLLLFAAPASAAFPIAKNGRIHACYKAKGKGKGALRVYRGARVRCPKKWRRISWPARHFSAPAVVPGPAGPQGPPGTAGVAVEELEAKFAELLAKVESLEAILSGITNQELLAALATVQAVESLCGRASELAGQVDDVEEALGGLKLNAVLTTLGGVLEVPTLPGSLSAYSCPSL